MFIKTAPERINIKGYVRNDCTVRGIGNALGLSYDLSRKILQTALFDASGMMFFRKKGPRTKPEFTLRTNVRNICRGLSEAEHVFVSDEELGKRMRGFPGVDYTIDKNNNLAQFAKDNPEGLFLIVMSDHLGVVIDGNIVDNWDSGANEVHVAYKVDIDEARDKIRELAKFYRMDNEQHIIPNHLENVLSIEPIEDERSKLYSI